MGVVLGAGKTVYNRGGDDGGGAWMGNQLIISNTYNTTLFW
jgi:hypothetical protein